MGFRSIFWKVISGKAPDSGWVDCGSVEHFEPYTPGQLTKNFTATVADEISVTRGTTVKALYRDDQWVYVQLSDGRRGFVPQAYCKLYLGAAGERGKTSSRTTAISAASLERKWEKSNLQRFIDSLPVQKDDGIPFELEEKCRASVLHEFSAISPDDLSVRQSEMVTVLNTSDSEWAYVRNDSNQLGFVPSSFLDLPRIECEKKFDKW
ncbi:unnamed protein product [Caenorhabditis bovis]|uniref:SH3 domain-containing protein n=1 Tax=Caenorhabditis bovis TaxID=2654633 RepID=A0A8S1F9D8_9PELO|nr:unnamed protein product [Caenorhabditis bovis]